MAISTTTQWVLRSLDDLSYKDQDNPNAAYDDVSYGLQGLVEATSQDENLAPLAEQIVEGSVNLTVTELQLGDMKESLKEVGRLKEQEANHENEADDILAQL